MTIKKRTTCFVATTNLQESLRDSTGSRRFWPVSVGVPLLDELADAVEQLWAEAVHLYRQGERHWLDQTQGEALRKHSERYQRVDPWEVTIAEKLPRLLATSDGRWLTVSEILQALEVDTDRQHVAQSMRIAGILTRLGWTKSRKAQAQGGRAWRWYPPEGSE